VKRSCRIVRLAERADPDTRVRISRCHADDPPMLRQFVPTADDGLGAIEQQRERLRWSEWISQQGADERRGPLVTPFAVAIQPLESIDLRGPILPLQIGLGRPGVRSDRDPAEPVHVVDHVAAFPTELAATRPTSR